MLENVVLKKLCVMKTVCVHQADLHGGFLGNDSDNITLAEQLCNGAGGEQ